MESELILDYFRGSERLFIVFFGGVSLLLGWHLFKIGVVADQRAEIRKADFTVNLQKVGPGIFFALFGAGVLIVAISFSFTQTSKLIGDDKTEKENTTSYFLKDVKNDEIFSFVEALNTISSVSQQLTNVDNPKIIEKLQESNLRLRILREKLLETGVGKGQYLLWKKHRNDYLSNKEKINDKLLLHKLEDIERWVNAEI